MRTLQNRWYNFLVDTLSLDRSLFQIWLPAAPIAATDASLWNCQNVIPPASLTFNRANGEAIRLSDQYVAVASQMEAPRGALAQAIGEPNAKAWSAFLATQGPIPADSDLPLLFQNWAARHATGVMSEGVAFLSRVVLARPAGGSPSFPLADAKLPEFGGGYADLLNLLGASSGASGDFDSRTVSADVSQTWTGGADSAVAGLWADNDGAPLHRKFAASTVTARVEVGARAQWVVIPAAWYDSSVLATAFSSAASPPWRSDATPSWNDFFAPGGSMRRAPASLLVVDALNITVTSDADFDRTEQQLILQHAPAGLWPLYAPITDAADTVVSFGRTDKMSIGITTRSGCPVMLGANVLGIARYLGRAD
ncbi:hypothetical protein [Tardiphaga sp.]|uniref:hypothetical protein n=1 Tax=Tardiphaga sp. TaxID=1926292 RepID=UPI0026328B6D|nr:hypothetical protein [Tardiphaga sp.]MDB5619275.1 hypothetical protein [Tardiphaga sp.]